ncbi:MAG: CotH kinase family protein [Prevotella sp.]|nr:CotH kinase family protein [Prevotella sp.]
MALLLKYILPIALLLLSLSSCSKDDEEEGPAVILPYETAFTTGLPVMVINTPDSCAIESKEVWVKNATVALYAPDGALLFHASTSIRGRGNVTWRRYPKKSYSLKLDRKASLADMKPAKRWVLLANWADRTLLRNDVSFEVARKTSMEWTPRGTHVELILNGVFIGNYYLCEKIQVHSNRLNITEMVGSDEDAVGITGGYLMEIDSYYDEENKFRSKVFDLPWQFRSPDEETLTPKMFDYMQQYVNDTERLLADDHALAVGSYRDKLDIQSFVDWWIINELCHNKEVGKPKSVYMYKERQQPLKAGPVWDFDYSTFTLRDNIFVAEHFPYLKRLFLSPDFRRMACERWYALKPAFDTIPDYIDRQARQLTLSQEQNIRMWPISSKGNSDEQLPYDEAISRMKQAFRLRLQVMDDFIEKIYEEDHQDDVEIRITYRKKRLGRRKI